MSAATQPTTFSDLYTSLSNKVRIETGVTATQDLAKGAINTALHDMHIGTKEKFPWAERSATLRTKAKYTTGTVAITKGSTAVTGTSTEWDTANDFSENNVIAGGKMVIEGSVDVYEVSSVASDTSLTLVQNFVGTTVTEATYVYFEDEYALHDDFLRPLSFRYFDQNRQISLLQRREFQEQFVRNKTTGKVRHAAIIDKAFSGSASPVRKVIFHQPPDTAYLIPYSFITDKLAVSTGGTEQVQMTADTDEPIVPLYARHGIVLHALYNWYRDRKNDDRSIAAKAEYESFMARLTADIEFGANRPQMRPRSYLPRKRRGGGRYSLGSRFDEIRDR